MIFGKWAGAVALLAVMGALTPAVAATTQYECKFTQELARGGGWVPEILILTEDDATGEILAFDPVIQEFVGTPIKAKLSGRTKNLVTYRWEVKYKNKGQAGRMIYSFSYYSNGNPAKIKVQPGGFDNSWSGDGTCKVSQG